MGDARVTREMLAAKFETILPHLDERQRRLMMGAEARALGHGGIRLVAAAAGVREATVSLGAGELEAGAEPLGRVRRPGGGRKRAADVDPGLVPALLALVEPSERGDPVSPLRWTVKSTRKLAAELTAQGHRVSADTVAGLLREQGFSLQANAKTLEGRQHPGRDAQFRYISEQARAHQDSGDPVISVDAKKKEKIGNFAAPGAEWAPKGQPVTVAGHDFPAQQQSTAIPYGIYDLAANTGWVNVGTDHNTGAFAAESVRRWWNAVGRGTYPQATRLLVTADAGGSNGYRTRAWKAALAALAAEAGLAITVCHFPPGTSKWNKIEHRLFSHISMNWRGRPLTSHEVIVNTIAATTTRAGLTVHAQLDTGLYPTGTQISEQQMAALQVTRHDFHGDWNYTLHPLPPHPPHPPPPAAPPARASQHTLAHPALTGITPAQLTTLTRELTTAFAARREQKLFENRGHARHRTGRHGRPKLDLADHLLAAILHDRLGLTYYAIAPLLGADYSTIGYAARLGRALLTSHGTTITPIAHLRTLTAFLDYATTAGVTIPPQIKPAC
jgi:Rhodopirellula transposase DDE domain